MEPKEPCRVSLSDRVLTDRQQVAAAGILVICLVIMIGHSTYRYWNRQSTVDIERPYDPRKVEFKLDINQAEWPEFTLLPEVSETMARRIVDYRNANGRFRSLDEIQQVHGIGPRTFELIRPYLADLGNAASLDDESRNK